MRVTEEEYVFVVFDEMQRWIPQLQAPFKPDEPPQPVLYDLSVQGEGGNELTTRLFAQPQEQDQSALRSLAQEVAGCGVLLQR